MRRYRSIVLGVCALAAFAFAGRVVASEETTRRLGTIPAVASAPGENGSRWETQIYVDNPDAARSVSYRFVLRRPAGAEDLEWSFTAAPSTLARVVFGDLPWRGGGGRNGSLDVYADAPLAVWAQVIQLSAGGWPESATEELVNTDEPRAGEVVTSGANVSLLTPLDMDRFRMNVGVRSLAEGATVTFQLLQEYQGRLTERETVVKTFAADAFEQTTLEALFPLTAARGRELLQFALVRAAVESGSAIVYGSTIDNATNAPRLRVGRVAPAASANPAAPASPAAVRAE